MPVIGMFRHYKGDVYKLLCDSAICEETGTRLCVYADAVTGQVYVRPFEQFFGAIDIDGKLVTRFVEC